ncbi:hypothetical protein I876_05100 [Alteromonas mediterranea U7]|jgi:hypothetical protein|nr:hypothetical protein I876_05100 [Alteromonas mediterranea U7]AGP92988.1 hypothetical protein I634_06310 [Alteromonas mediterranea U8]
METAFKILHFVDQLLITPFMENLFNEVVSSGYSSTPIAFYFSALLSKHCLVTLHRIRLNDDKSHGLKCMANI